MSVYDRCSCLGGASLSSWPSGVTVLSLSRLGDQARADRCAGDCPQLLSRRLCLLSSPAAANELSLTGHGDQARAGDCPHCPRRSCWPSAAASAGACVRAPAHCCLLSAAEDTGAAPTRALEGALALADLVPPCSLAIAARAACSAAPPCPSATAARPACSAARPCPVAAAARAACSAVAGFRLPGSF